MESIVRYCYGSQTFWTKGNLELQLMESSLCALQDINTKIYLYADDAKIYKVINQMPDQFHLQAVVNLVKNWSDEWLLRLNIDKCKTV